MKEIEFYRCPMCRQVVMVTTKGIGTLNCCGGDMVKLIPSNEDKVKEKHVPLYVRSGNKLTVTVGAVIHPSSDDHYIEWIALVTNKGISYKYLNPGETPVVSFLLEEDEKPISIYSYCNIHSLWVKEVK